MCTNFILCGVFVCIIKRLLLIVLRGRTYKQEKKRHQQQRSRVYFIVTESEIVPNNELNFYKFRIFSLMASKYCIRLGTANERARKKTEPQPKYYYTLTHAQYWTLKCCSSRFHSLHNIHFVFRLLSLLGVSSFSSTLRFIRLFWQVYAMNIASHDLLL